MSNQTTDYILATTLIRLETKVDAIINFLSNAELNNPEALRDLKSYVSNHIKQETNTIAEKVISLIGGDK